jgi:hypothetical protein
MRSSLHGNPLSANSDLQELQEAEQMTINDPKLQDEFCSQQNDARYRSA